MELTYKYSAGEKPFSLCPSGIWVGNMGCYKKANPIWGCIHHSVMCRNHEIIHALCSTLIKPTLESNFHLYISDTILGNWRWAREKEWKWLESTKTYLGWNWKKVEFFVTKEGKRRGGTRCSEWVSIYSRIGTGSCLLSWICLLRSSS